MASITIANTAYEFALTPEQLASLGEKAAYSNSQKQKDENPWESDLAYFEWVMGVWHGSQLPPPTTEEVSAKITTTLNSYAAVETPVEVPIEELSPEAAKAKLIAYAADKRWRLETGGMTVYGIKIPTDDRAKLLLMGAASYMKDQDIAPFIVEGKIFELSGLQFKYIYSEMIERTKNLFITQSNILSDIESGKITTQEEIESYNW